MGFAEQLQEIIGRLPGGHQTVLFSATLPKLLVEFARAGEPVGGAWCWPRGGGGVCPFMTPAIPPAPQQASQSPCSSAWT